MSVSRGLRLPGVGASSASTPDNAKYTPATSIEVRVVAAATDWTPTQAKAIVHQSAFIVDIGWHLLIGPSGQIQVQWSPDGTFAAMLTKTATATPAAIDGFPRGVGFRLVLATGDVTFLHSADGFTWIAFQTDTSAPSTAVFNSGQPLAVGGTGGASFDGLLLSFELRVDNKIVADPAFDEQLPGATSFDDSRGNKWTFGAAAFIEAHTSFVPSDDQILDCDGVHRRADRFRFELCDRELRPIGDLHPDRVGSVPSIENDTSSSTSRRLRGFRLLPDEADDVNVIADRLRVYMILQNGTEYRLGTFLWADANQPKRSWGLQHDADLVDQSYILDQQSTQAFGWQRGVNIQLIMLFLLARAGFELADIAAIGDESLRSLTAPVAWQPGTTWLQMLKDLGAICGFASPWFDRDGLLHFDQVPDPAVSEATVPAYGDAGRVIADSIVYSNDLLVAPNDFGVFDSSTDRIRSGRYQLPASAPHSVQNRGFRIGRTESVQGLTSQALADKAAANLARTSIGYELLTFNSIADPRHDTWDVVDAFDQRWLETAWTIDLRSGGPMKHTMRRTIYAL